ncbi:hypothetical protein BCR44DRAFT_77006 [Catenaria anguillulae PL171]|uniref:Transmembrane protein n=1 Tax=Catenaria anguillulae PL171 TaxID=765915 RepID=A0A1Y2HZ26_9FUNG|nr:hypothetical protein BCR44DRAFT_77006 [Catenaria anguillulae PL171]
MTCVRNGPGPVIQGVPQFPNQAAQSAAEKPDDSIPPRPPSASTRATASATTSTTTSTSRVSSTATPPTGSATSVSNTRSDDSSTASSFPLSWPILAGICLLIGVASAVLCGRVRRYKPRPPTTPPQGPFPGQTVAPPPKPTHTSAPPIPSPAPSPPTPVSSQPYGSAIEHHVEYVTIGQTNTVVEVPLQPLTSSNPYAYPPQSPTQMLMPMPLPQPQIHPFEAQPNGRMQMPTPQRMSLNGSTLHSQLSSSSPYPPAPQVQVQADSVANSTSDPWGVRVEVASGPCDAELALPSRRHSDAELALPGGFQQGATVQVHGNPEDDELVLPGPGHVGGVANK